MPEFGIIVLTIFFAMAVILAVILAYCSAVDGGATHSSD